MNDENENNKQEPLKGAEFKFDFEALKKSAENMPEIEVLRVERDAMYTYINTLASAFETISDLSTAGAPPWQVGGLAALHARITRNAIAAMHRQKK